MTRLKKGNKVYIVFVNMDFEKSQNITVNFSNNVRNEMNMEIGSNPFINQFSGSVEPGDMLIFSYNVATLPQ